MTFAKEIEIDGHAGAIYTCGYDQHFVYTGSGDKYVTRWNLIEGIQDKFAIRFEQSIYSLDFLDESRLIVGLADGGLHVFDLVDRLELHYFTQHTKGIFSIAVNHLKNHVYVADADGNLSVWDRITLKLLIYLPLDAGKIRDISISSDGERFALACQDGTIRIFESNFFNELITLNAHEPGATSVLFHPTHENELISGGKDALLKHWNLADETAMQVIPAHNYAIYSLIALNNGQTIVSASRDKTIKIWSSNLEFQQRLDVKSGGHRHSVNKLRKLDEQRFVSVSDDKRVIVWKAENAPT